MSRNRRKIERRGGKWFPVASAEAQSSPSLSVKEKSHRDLLGQVASVAKRAMGASEMADAVLRIDPERHRGSLTAEVHRMCKAGLLIEKGTNGRGGLFILSNGGSRPTAD